MKNNFKYVKRATCRLCGSKYLKPILSLGNQFINDFPVQPSLKGKNGKCPLDIVFCSFCNLYQLLHSAPQEILYSRHYWYKSGINEKIQRDLKEIAEIGCQLTQIGLNDIFLDIGANDGTLLKNLRGKAITVGCEPASNLQSELRSNCDFVIEEFWNVDSYCKLGLKKAKVITAIGMFYDMEDPNQFIRDARSVLAEDGIFIAQLMTLKPMLESNDLGNICHEHLEYYTYPSLKYLFEKNGLEIFKLEENEINGGSYRLYARHFKNGSVDYIETLTEKDLQNFKINIDYQKKLCLGYLKDCSEKGKKIYVYGASTKGNVILQYYGIDNSLIEGAADRNQAKWGKYTLTDIPIVSEEEGRRKADCFLVLPFGFINEFLEREKKWLQDGGQFIVPLPQFKVFSKD